MFSFLSSAWERQSLKLCFTNGPSPLNDACCFRTFVRLKRKRSFQDVRSQAELGNELVSGACGLRDLVTDERIVAVGFG